MRGKLSGKTVLSSIMVVFLPCVAQAATVLFGEPATETGNTSFLAIDANGFALPACAGAPPAGGCVDTTTSTMGPESASVTLRFPLGALGGNNLSATAYLL